MKKIRTEVIIEGTCKEVWEELTDFDSYPEWNPFIHIKGSPGLGNTLENTMFLVAGGKPQVFRPKIIIWEEQKGFSWLGHLFVPGIFDGEHFFELVPHGNGYVRLIHGENFNGILSGLFMKLIGNKTMAAFIRMNAALKERVEANL